MKRALVLWTPTKALAAVCKSVKFEQEIRESIKTRGFAIVQNFLDDAGIDQLLAALDGHASRGRAGIRQPHLNIPAVAEFLRGAELRRWLNALIPGGFVVRTLFFDKTAEANWHVPWHQDLSICVKARHNVSGFNAWSLKEGIQHVQPPEAILERMLTIRLHLDDCNESNGPLQVIPGSHAHGRLDSDASDRLCERVAPVNCVAPRGGAVLMKPLLLHASSPARIPRHRRVLHMEFAAEALPLPLDWFKS